MRIQAERVIRSALVEMGIVFDDRTPDGSSNKEKSDSRKHIVADLPSPSPDLAPSPAEIEQATLDRAVEVVRALYAFERGHNLTIAAAIEAIERLGARTKP